MNLFYSVETNTDYFQLPLTESLHCLRVLRLKEGDKIHVTNGNGLIVEAEITDKKIDGTSVKVSKVIHDKKCPDFKLNIALPILKNQTRYEWFIEKSIELGTTRISPIVSSLTEKKRIRTERLRKIALEAMKQSLQPFLAQIDEASSFSEFLSSCPANTDKFIAYCGVGFNLSKLKRKKIVNNNIIVMIGPEGDFTQKEISEAVEHGFVPVNLGKSRLRSETAGVYIASVIHSFYNEHDEKK